MYMELSKGNALYGKMCELCIVGEMIHLKNVKDWTYSYAENYSFIQIPGKGVYVHRCDICGHMYRYEVSYPVSLKNERIL